jgi:hypothetical protein
MLNLKQKMTALVLLTVAAAASTSQAFAAVPVEATDALTAVQTDGGSLISAGWPVLAAITGALVLMGLFKKVVGKAT